MPRGFQQIQEEEEEEDSSLPLSSPFGGGGRPLDPSPLCLDLDSDLDPPSSTLSPLPPPPPPPPRPSPPAPLTPTLLLSVFAATLSSLQFGYNIGVINAPQKVLEAEYNLTWTLRWGSPPPPTTISTLWALSVAIFSVGGMASSLGVAELANRLGRKGALLAVNGLAVVGGALMGGAKLGPTYTLLIIGRFVIGAYSGLASGLVPMYVGEIAPTRLRGALGALHQLGIVCGILGAQVLGLGQLLGTPRAWPALLGAGLLPAALQLLLLPLCPESPRFLLGRGQRARARTGLVRLQGAEQAEAGLAAMEAELQGHTQRVGLLQLCLTPRYRQPLLVTLVLQLAQQLSGINAIFYYSTAIFERAGLTQPAYGTIGTGVVNVAATALAVVLVERAGRRLLELVGLLGMLSCAIALTIGLSLQGGAGAGPLSLGAVLLFVAFFAVGPGPIPWFVGAELFGQGPRPAAMALAGAANWGANFGVAMAFPALSRALGPFVFLLFGALLAFFALFTFLRLPETKGSTFGPGGTLPRGGGRNPPEKTDTELQSLAGGGEEEDL